MWSREQRKIELMNLWGFILWANFYFVVSYAGITNPCWPRERKKNFLTYVFCSQMSTSASSKIQPHWLKTHYFPSHSKPEVMNRLVINNWTNHRLFSLLIHRFECFFKGKTSKLSDFSLLNLNISLFLYSAMTVNWIFVLGGLNIFILGFENHYFLTFYRWNN